MTISRKVSFGASGQNVSAIVTRPEDAQFMVVLGHGSGSNNKVPLIHGLAQALAAEKCATFCFNYPYSESPDFVPFSDMPTDGDAVLIDTIISAIAAAKAAAPDLDLIFAGHSLSAFLATIADAEIGLAAKAQISLAFPSKGDAARGAHLDQLRKPTFFVQGTQDPLGTVDEITALVNGMGANAKLQWIKDASHGFSVEGRPESDVYAEIASHIRHFASTVTAGGG